MTHCLPDFENFNFPVKILFLMFNAVCFYTWSYPPNRSCWFLIANIELHQTTLCSNLKKIGAKLRTWECLNAKMQNGRNDLIKFEMSKTVKKFTGTHTVSVRSFVKSFIEIGSFIWAAEMPHVYAQTDTQSGVDCNIFSQNTKTCACFFAHDFQAWFARKLCAKTCARFIIFCANCHL